MTPVRQQEFVLEHLSLFACPACSGPVRDAGEAVVCQNCGERFPLENGIPLFFYPDDPGQKRDVTDVVKTFYEENPFPNYDDLDSRESLSNKARRGVFARVLDEQIPTGAMVLEAGCGTGQLSNFLGMSWRRRVFGADLCVNSLRLAKAFRDRFNIVNAGFVQMNLFRPPFRDEVFDVVISSGVLHHTSDPLGGFRSIARLVKPGGYILVGLYNTIGRLPTDFRRLLFKTFGDWASFLDDHMRKDYNEARKRAWFMDQYKHPRESKHSYSEALGWLESSGFDFLMSIPKIGPSTFGPDEQLFAPHSKGTAFSRRLTELDMLVRGGADGALFIMIGQKQINSMSVTTR
jgi:SAM-dependent methyltransferase